MPDLGRGAGRIVGMSLPTLAGELAALEDARQAVDATLQRLGHIRGFDGGADEFAEQFIDAVVAGRIAQLQQDLVVFGRVDDPEVFRIGIFGIDRGGDQLVVDWRARFAAAFYQATLEDPMGLTRRVSYVGHIADLMVEDLVEGGISGSSPLMAELSRNRGTEMRTAVATLQSDQDRLVRLDPDSRLVLRGGPGTGKTVVALHRAAWLIYNDTRITSDRVLVVGPSDRFLAYVSTVLPTLGESQVVQTTFGRMLGPTAAAAADPRWPAVLDAFEQSLLRPGPLKVGRRRFSAEEIDTILRQASERDLPYKERRRVVISRLAAMAECDRRIATEAVAEVMVAMSGAAAWKRLTSRRSLMAMGVEADLIDDWMRQPDDGGLRDEVMCRFDGLATRFGHVIVDEGQDMTPYQLAAIMRRADGLTIVGDDAQQSVVGAVGLRGCARILDTTLETMATAYRMSAEIADWLNAWAEANSIDAVELLGIRPNGIAVAELDGADPATVAKDLARRWGSVATIVAGDVWIHKGVEYDAVVVDSREMSGPEVYLAASRAAHELVVIR